MMHCLEQLSKAAYVEIKEHSMIYRRLPIPQLHARAIAEEIGERLRFLMAMKPSRLSHRLLVLMQRLAKLDR